MTDKPNQGQQFDEMQKQKKNPDNSQQGVDPNRKPNQSGQPGHEQRHDPNMDRERQDREKKSA